MSAVPHTGASLVGKTRRTSRGCWNWQGTRDHKGYGQVGVGNRTRRAHRVAYQYLVGPIPDGLWVLHACDNRACINPKHLYLGTAKDNNMDRLVRGRWAGGRRKKNHRRHQKGYYAGRYVGRSASKSK